MVNRLAIVGGSIVTRDEVIENGVALCEDSYIKAVGSSGAIEPEPGSRIIDIRASWKYSKYFTLLTWP